MRTPPARAMTGAPSRATAVVLCFVSAVLVIGTTRAMAQPQVDVLDWSQTPDLPVPAGLGGAFAGVSNGALIVAGGTNFPDKPFNEGGQKAWHDEVYVLPEPDGEWLLVDTPLPRPLGYGGSVSYGDLMICIGGANDQGHYAEVFALRWNGADVEVVPLPDLPRANAFLAAAVLEGTLYVAGGHESPDATSAMRAFWALDLDAAVTGGGSWVELEPWPGPERRLAVAGAQAGALYLFSGMRLVADDAGRARPEAPYLKDAYRYDPGAPAGLRWEQIADLPQGAAAGPSPALTIGQSHLFLLGGLDGSSLGQPLESYPPFPDQVWAYHTITDTWAQRGTMPPGEPRVTTPTVAWADGFVVPAGEIAPGQRTPGVALVRVADAEGGFGKLDWTVLSVYFAAMLGIGVFFAKGTGTTRNFFLADRKIPWWASGISIFGTQLSAITFIAVPAVAFAGNWTQLLGSVAIFLVAPLVIYFYLPFFRRLNVTTAYEYLEMRFSIAVRLLGSAIFIIAQVGRMGVVLFLPAITLEVVTGMDVWLCILLMGLLSTAYTFLGGMSAVIWTDVCQVLVLLTGALLCLFVVAWSVGGVGEVVTVGLAEDKFRFADFGWSPFEMVAWVILIGSLAMNLSGYTSNQSVVQRYLTTSDESRAARGIWLNGLMSLPAAGLFFLVGTAIFVFYKHHPADIRPGRTDDVMPWFVVDHLPLGVPGLVIAGVFAAAMSTLSSGMNSITTAYVTDFHRRLRRATSEATSIRLAKLGTAVAGLLGTGAGMALAFLDIGLIYNAFITAMGLLGGGLAGIFMLAVFTRRANAIGALCGAAVGSAVPVVVSRMTDINFYLFELIGISVTVGVGYLVSIATPRAAKPLEGLTLWTLTRKQAEGFAGATAPATAGRVARTS